MATAAAMQPSIAIESVERMVESLRRKLDALEAEALGVKVHWNNLGRVGGQREDAAAALLGKLLLPHVRAVESFASTVAAQLEGMQRDPFAFEND